MANEIPLESQFKVFVRGLSNSISEKKLRTYFEQKYSTVITDCTVKRPKTSPKQIGFVTFKDAAKVDKVLTESHVIGDSTFGVERFRTREDINNGLYEKQLFVGGLKEGTKEKHLREAFESYGELVRIRIEGSANKKGVFAFVELRNSQVVDVLEKLGELFVNDVRVEVRKRVPERLRKNNQNPCCAGCPNWPARKAQLSKTPAVQTQTHPGHAHVTINAPAVWGYDRRTAMAKWGKKAKKPVAAPPAGGNGGPGGPGSGRPGDDENGRPGGSGNGRPDGSGNDRPDGSGNDRPDGSGNDRPDGNSQSLVAPQDSEPQHSPTSQNPQLLPVPASPNPDFPDPASPNPELQDAHENEGDDTAPGKRKGNSPNPLSPAHKRRNVSTERSDSKSHTEH